MSDEERTEERQNEDVEAHGAKQIAAAGLAGAALIGAGAVGVKMATDDDDTSRNQGALVERGTASNLAKADTDRDGYVSYQDLEAVGYKYDTELMKVEGFGGGADALSAAGYKLQLALVGKEKGFPVEGETIMLKYGVTRELDGLAKGAGEEWAKKIKPLDRDEDGYLDYEALAEAGKKVIINDEGPEELAGKHVEIKELHEAGVKIRSADLGEGGFSMEEDAIFLKYGVNEKVDAFIKGEGG